MSGSSTGRFQGENRFYCTPARRNLQQQQQQQQLLVQKKRQLIEKEKKLKSQSEVENRTGGGGSNDSTSSKQPSLCSSTGGPTSNLDSFLRSTTPYVPAQPLAKTMARKLRNGDVDFNSYFLLGDLWEFFKEWSAYGAGVPLVLNDSDSVVQYYVPFLSALQIYVNPSKPSSKFQRRPGEDSDLDSSRESCSYGSSHTSDTSEDGDGHPPSLLKFQYFERESPYIREPLADKIFDLASRFPELKTYKSCDLLPTSWLSIAWYPIYRIPTGPTLRDLEACFLTFHPLSTPLSSNANGLIDASPKLSLPIFGLASFKFKGSVWAPNGHYELQRTNSLLQAADNWLRRLQVDHPDYQYFVSHNSFER